MNKSARSVFLRAGHSLEILAKFPQNCTCFGEPRAWKSRIMCQLVGDDDFRQLKSLSEATADKVARRETRTRNGAQWMVNDSGRTRPLHSPLWKLITQIMHRFSRTLSPAHLSSIVPISPNVSEQRMSVRSARSEILMANRALQFSAPSD